MPRIMIADSLNIGLDLDYSIFTELGDLTVLEEPHPEGIQHDVKEHSPDIIIANRPLFSAAILHELGSAKRGKKAVQLVCLTATGLNTVDLDAARKEEIAICNIVGYSTVAVAEHCLALVLGLMHHLVEYHQHSLKWADLKQPAKRWTDLSLPIHEIAGKTWGIIGMGKIGRRVAELARALGADVLWTSTKDIEREEAWPYANLEDLLGMSDIVSIHSPIHEHSRGLLNAETLRLMKKTAILVNVGRGGIIDEPALAAALDEGAIAGAALDVLWPEPPRRDNPLFFVQRPERLLWSPHIAWAAVEARQRALQETALNIISFMDGERRNRVD